MTGRSFGYARVSTDDQNLAMQIKALFEFNKRHNLSKVNNNPIKCAKDVFEYASQRLNSNDKEVLVAAGLAKFLNVKVHDTLVLFSSGSRMIT